MTAPVDIRFYHLTKQPIGQALPKLLEKIIQRGHKILIHSPDVHLLEQLDQDIWGYDPVSFLPHSIAGSDKHAAKQPILLNGECANENSADILLLLNGAFDDSYSQYAMTLLMFDGKQPQVVQECRGHWKTLSDMSKSQEGISLTYWQQTENGGWDKKA